jgi:hypothetical protein
MPNESVLCPLRTARRRELSRRGRHQRTTQTINPVSRNTDRLRPRGRNVQKLSIRCRRRNRTLHRSATPQRQQNHKEKARNLYCRFDRVQRLFLSPSRPLQEAGPLIRGEDNPEARSGSLNFNYSPAISRCTGKTRQRFSLQCHLLAINCVLTVVVRAPQRCGPRARTLPLPTAPLDPTDTIKVGAPPPGRAPGLLLRSF